MSIASSHESDRIRFLDEKFLHYSFPQPYRTASWAILGGGLSTSHGVAWLQVEAKDIKPPINPIDFLRERMKGHSLTSHVGLMTSAKLSNVSSSFKSFGNRWVRSVATVGLGNAMQVGENPSPSGRIGTINILVECDKPLTDEGLMEGLSMVSEAKTLALLKHGIKSYMSGKLATGTGTDCTVIASPLGSSAAPYCGKHTSLGHLIGATVLDAVDQGISKWIRDNPNHKLLGESSWEKFI